jgi:hypothetical protein
MPVDSQPLEFLALKARADIREDIIIETNCSTSGLGPYVMIPCSQSTESESPSSENRTFGVYSSTSVHFSLAPYVTR